MRVIIVGGSCCFMIIAQLFLLLTKLRINGWESQRGHVAERRRIGEESERKKL